MGQKKREPMHLHRLARLKLYFPNSYLLEHHITHILNLSLILKCFIRLSTY
jgi:hypothetical protein